MEEITRAQLLTERPPRPPRADALPELADYSATGCSAHPDCLTCPFAVCRYDTGYGLERRGVSWRHIANAARDAAIVEAMAALPDTIGAAEEVGRRFGVSRRTVWRIVADARRGAA